MEVYSLIVSHESNNEEREAVALASIKVANMPPITNLSLAELDIDAIINNSKLRHDVNFDRELHFRPNLDGERARQKVKAQDSCWGLVAVNTRNLSKTSGYEQLATDPRTMSSKSSLAQMSAEHKYYDKIGDLNMLRECLFNLESEFRLRKRARDFEQWFLGAVVPCDADFSKTYSGSRATMVQEYSAARIGLEVLRHLCQEEGLEVKSPNILPLLDEPFSGRSPGDCSKSEARLSSQADNTTTVIKPQPRDTSPYCPLGKKLEISGSMYLRRTSVVWKLVPAILR